MTGPLAVKSSLPTFTRHKDGSSVPVQEHVARLAKLAQSSGLDGVVCSAQEVELIRGACGSEFLTVTPGIRPEGSQQGDQRRVMTPLQAKDAGVDYMVIGRPVTQSEQPKMVCELMFSKLLK